jgi:hypothetical protein
MQGAVQCRAQLGQRVWMLFDADVDEVRSLDICGKDAASDWMLQSPQYEPAGV